MGERRLRRLQFQTLRELLDGEIFYTLKEAKIVIEGWRRHDNTVRIRIRH